VFTGSLSWDQELPSGSAGWISETGIPTLKDASGQKIPIEEVRMDAPYDEFKMVWSYRTNRKIFSGPLVLSFPSVNTTVLPPQQSFEFDLGSNPQMGQSWEIHRDFVFAGHTVRLLSARLVELPSACWKSALEFGFESSNPAVGVASVNDVVPQPPSTEICSGGGGGGIHEPVDPKISFVPAVYSSIPTGGVHRFTLDPVVGSVVTGPWQVAWNPPFSAEPTPTPEPEACLTLEKWTQLAGRNDPLPSGLGGRILVSVDAGMSNMANPTPGFPLIQISNLDGSDRRPLVNGGWETLSPDGRRLIYTNDNGFNILDLSTGQVSSIGVNGYAPIFSPDGSRILYTRFPGMYVMQSDGSGSQKINVGAAEITPPLGWLPDNQTILYSVMGGKGFTFVKHNLDSGETQELFTVRSKHGFGAISPDGQWIAFVEMGFGANSWGVFIARLDGSERKLVASSEISIASLLTWSPDGEWLLVNTQDYRQSDPNTVYRPVLIKPATCQVVGIPPTLGYVEAWVK
ncbi:MAG: hypothetical protein U1B80_05750, partial [Anaerolineaceae bacterium]|nr:hypothetical protein [Anaerolineaceae bacterium]